MTGKNVPYVQNGNVIADADNDGFHTTVNFLFMPPDGISSSARIDSKTASPIISGRVMFHHPDKSGLTHDVLSFALRSFFKKLRVWGKILTDDSLVNIYPKAIIQDHGLAESLVRVLKSINEQHLIKNTHYQQRPIHY